MNGNLNPGWLVVAVVYGGISGWYFGEWGETRHPVNLLTAVVALCTAGVGVYLAVRP